MKIKNMIMIMMLVILMPAFGFGMGNLQKSQAVKKEKDVYYCPMHTNYTSDHPGQCPYCGMNLVKK